METRSRKRAAVASSSASKRSRTRRSSASAPTPAMDPSPSSRRRARAPAADKGKDPDPSSTSNPSPPVAPDDDDDSGAPFPHSFTSASTALQGLLRRLGAGLDDLLPSSAAAAAASSSSSSSTSAQLKRILAGLQADGDEPRQLQSLTQLCEMLSIGTEESLAAFPVDAFVPILDGLLGREEAAGGASPDVMLLAARALANLVDVLPSSCSAVVHYGAIPCFCARLLTIEYMDLAEQSLQALKKVSQEHPTACLRAGALMAVLSYLDFFSTGVQRVALSTAANICRKLPSDASEFVMEAVPLLTNLLNHHDSKVLEHASVCLTRIAEAFSSYPDKLDELCNHGLVAQAASLVSVSNSIGQTSLSTSTYTQLRQDSTLLRRATSSRRSTSPHQPEGPSESRPSYGRSASTRFGPAQLRRGSTSQRASSSRRATDDDRALQTSDRALQDDGGPLQTAPLTRRTYQRGRCPRMSRDRCRPT